MKFTIIALVSAFAAVTTAEFCDSGAAGVGACENIDKNTFCCVDDQSDAFPTFRDCVADPEGTTCPSGSRAKCC
ncbi:hypothetical protein F5883DRAFT_644329 [Diaporthe sp. PMI_573]|nr:hypothetical protein F5883DRAFT_644329 [Diaporthaceae sp. PMI_573]